MKVKVATTKMAFMWRRRSSLFKIVLLLMAVWFTIAFLLYTDESRSSAPSGQDNIMQMGLKRDYDAVMAQEALQRELRGDVNENEIGEDEEVVPVINRNIEDDGGDNLRPNVNKAVNKKRKQPPLKRRQPNEDEGKEMIVYL